MQRRPRNSDHAFALQLPCIGVSLCAHPGPRANAENDDHNPPRIASRNLFDVSLGHDNLFRGDKYKVELRD